MAAAAYYPFTTLSPLAQILAIAGLPVTGVVSYIARTYIEPNDDLSAKQLVNGITATGNSGWRKSGAGVATLLRLAMVMTESLALFLMLNPAVPGIPLPWPAWSFYTIQTYGLSFLYYTIALVLSFGRFCSPSFLADPKPCTQRFIRVVHVLYQYLLAANVLVSVGYWCITRITIDPAYRYSYSVSFQCIIHHVLNTVFVLLEFYINESPLELRNWDICAYAAVIYYVVSVFTYGIIPSIALDLRDVRSCSVVMLLLGSVVGYYFLFCLADRLRAIIHQSDKADGKNDIV